MLRGKTLGAVLVAACFLITAQVTGPSRAAWADPGGSDWPTYLSDNDHTSYADGDIDITPANAATLGVDWEKVVAADRKTISIQPTTANGLVYWGGWDGVLHASDPDDGSSTWASSSLGFTTAKCGQKHVSIAGSPTIATESINGVSTSMLYVGGGRADMYGFNAQTGAQVWHTRLGVPPNAFIWSSPVVYNGKVFVGVSSFSDCPLIRGRVVKLDAVNGHVLRTFYTVPTGCLGASIWSTPTLDAATGTIFLTTGNGGKCSQPEPYGFSVVSLRASDLHVLGSWQVPGSTRVVDSDFGGTPTLFTGMIGGISTPLVGAANKNGLFYAFARNDLNAGPVWTARIAKGGDCPNCGDGSIAPAAWDGTTLYVAGGTLTINNVACKGNVEALNPSTGAAIWQTCVSGPVIGAVAASTGLVEVGSGSTLYVVAAATGNVLYQYTVTDGGVFWGGGTISHGVLYHGDNAGHLYAFTPQTTP